jgi:hypothetical protein
MISPEEDTELQTLQHLSDDALWAVAHERLDVGQEVKLQRLMDRNSFGLLNEDQIHELEQMVEHWQKLILRKSQATVLLIQRGFKIDPYSVSHK